MRHCTKSIFLLAVVVLVFTACEIDFQPEIEGTMADDLVLIFEDTMYYPGSCFVIPKTVVSPSYTGEGSNSVEGEWAGSFTIKNMSPRNYTITSEPSVLYEYVEYYQYLMDPQQYQYGVSNLPATQLSVNSYTSPPQDMLAPEDTLTFMLRLSYSATYGNAAVQGPLTLVAETEEGDALSFAFDIYGIMSC